MICYFVTAVVSACLGMFLMALLAAGSRADDCDACMRDAETAKDNERKLGE